MMLRYGLRTSLVLLLLLLTAHSAQSFSFLMPNKYIHTRPTTTTTTSSLKVPLRYTSPQSLKSRRLPRALALRLTQQNNNNEQDSSPSSEDAKRVRVDFENFLKGMNRMGGDANANPREMSSQESSQSSSNNNQDDDDDKILDDKNKNSWFDPIQSDIEQKYARIKTQMLEQLEQQRQEDPESVPDNAFQVMESVWQQEMDEELFTARETAAKELLADYESRERDLVERKDLTGTEDSETARYVQQELKEEEDRRRAIQSRVDEFEAYKQNVVQRAPQEGMQVPEGDLDEWTLQRLEEMLSARQDDDDASVAYSLEESIEDLKARMEKEQQKGSIRPETMKEWQMYRSIATRLQKEDTEQVDEDEEAIASQLESWRSFQKKEQSIRKQSGLSRGPKMPFDWNEVEDRSIVDENVETSKSAEDTPSRAEIRDEVNRQAIKALEEMIQGSTGARMESLQSSLDALKAGIEAERAAGEVAIDGVEEVAGPVDVSDIFDLGKPTRQTFSRTTRKERKEEKSSPPEEDSLTPEYDDFSLQDEPFTPTPSFSETEEVVATQDAPLPPPDTPFFSDQDEDEIEQVELESSKLGTIDEQKLRTMYRRAGAVTEEEQAKIKEQWDKFKSIEKQKRDVSGLSDTDDSGLLSGDELSYDIKEVLKDDGDIDAEKILSRIGPRPTRSRKGTSGVTKSPPSDMDSEEVDTKDRITEQTSEITPEEVTEELYRSVAAVGADPTKNDPVAKAKERAAFEEFVRKEDDARETLEEMDANSASDMPSELVGEAGPESLDDLSYAEEVLSSISPRPPREPKSAPTESVRSEVVSKRDESADDTDYMEQEYKERRPPKRQRQMGIDIAEVLGVDSPEEDGYDDYTPLTWERGRSFSSFDSRKSKMLGLTDLSERELNALMDHKHSVDATGISQYLPRIKKPFRDFGAIFRLEGALLDMTGLQYDAWTRTAEVHGYKPPRLEDVRLASVTDPEIAPRKIFFWTDDFLLCKEIARTHRGALAEVFLKWMKDNNVTYNKARDVSSPTDQTAGTREDVVRPPIVVDNFEDAIEIQGSAWTATAEKFGFSAPTLDEVIFASAISPDDAVRNAFRWTSDPTKVSEVVRAYQRFVAYYADVDSDIADPFGEAAATTKSDDGVQSPGILSENDLLEIQYKAWLKVAEDYDLEPPNPDEALGAMVINDPALVVRDGFAWTKDPALVDELVASYQAVVRKLVRERAGSTEEDDTDKVPKVASVSRKPDEATQDPSLPTKEEIWDMQVYSWAVAAQQHGFDGSLEQVQAALLVEPEAAITQVYRWTNDDNLVRDIASTYKEEMRRQSKKYIGRSDIRVEKEPAKVATSTMEKSEGPSKDELFQAAYDAWEKIAKERGFTPPNADQVQFAMTVGPMDALVTFKWTEDLDERKEILEAYLRAVQETSSKWQSQYKVGISEKLEPSIVNNVLPPYTVTPGVHRWLQSLADVEMPGGIISYLERDQVDVLLEQSGLDKFFPSDQRVTASSQYSSERQQMLGAALRLERRPDHCVVFDVTPQSSVAAHDVGMKSVSLVGAYPMYDLLTADSTARSLNELSAINIRRLFAENVYDQPMADSLEDRPDPSSRRKVRTRFWEEGDRE